MEEKIMGLLQVHLEMWRDPNLAAPDLNIGMMFGQVWQQWSLYPPRYLLGLEATFQRKGSDLEVEVSVHPDSHLIT